MPISADLALDWLMEPDNPSVRYWTMRDFGREGDLEEARAAISHSPLVERIFSRQAPGGYWGDSTNPYLPKYKATYWTVMLLGYLGLSREDERVQRAVEYIFRFQQPDGGFAVFEEEGARREYAHVVQRKKARGQEPPAESAFIADQIHQMTLSCLTGHVCAALLRFGYGDDPRLQRALAWLIAIQNADGGWLCPYWKAHVRDKHGCFFGTICTLEAFAEVYYVQRSPAMKEAAAGGAEFLLRHHLYRADHHDGRIINPGWLQLRFPWFYGYSILRGLWVLNKLGYFVEDDQRMEDALNVLSDKMTSDGTWLLEAAPEGRMQVNLERKGQPSKWITLKAQWVMFNTLD